jgi:membrane protein
MGRRSGLFYDLFHRIENYLPFSSTLIAGMDFIVSLLIITLLFASLFKILPHADLQWRHVWFGAFVTALLFVIGKTAIGFYIGQSDLATSYGSVGSLIIILIWVFYSAQIFFFGSEITKVYVQKKGQIITPSSDAVKIERVEKEQEKL